MYIPNMASEDINTNKVFLNNMHMMFDGDDDAVSVIGKYRDDNSQTNVISVGTRVTLRTDSGSRDYLLLRVIPIESMKKIWVFPMNFSDAEVSIITNSGAYVIQSSSMRSENFIEYIRGYNFSDNYNGVDELVQKLADSKNGMLKYKDFRGEDCYWYYSSFGDGSGLDILGYIKADSLADTHNNWTVVGVICAIMLLLVLIDGYHIMHINHSLRESAKLAEQASLAKTQFLSSMSHDIRTPMNAVIGMTELAKRNSEDREYVRECLDKISSAGNHLITLVNDILDISKVESGKMRLDPTAFAIDSFISGIVDIIRPQTEAKNQELCGKYSEFPVKYIIADTSTIRDDMLEDFTVDGKLLSLPMAQKMYGMAVNKTLLEKEGLEMPQNYSEFLSVLEVLKNKGYVPVQGASSCLYSGLVYSEAMDMLLSDENLRNGIDSGSPDAVSAMTSVYSQLQTIIGNGYTDYEINSALPFDNYDGSILNFLDGDVPFWICDTEKFSGVKKRESKSESFSAEPFEYEFTLIPMGENGVYEYSEPWCGFSLNKESDVYDYAAEFLRFAAAKDQLEILASVKGVPSVTKDAADDERYTAVKNLNNIEMSCVMDGSIENHVMTLFATYANKLGEGEITSPEEAAQEFVDKCTEVYNSME